MEDVESERAEARYAHLLEPIRDLAQNWAIDIASEVRPQEPLCGVWPF